MDDLILIRRIDKDIKIVTMTNRLLSEMGSCSNSDKSILGPLLFNIFMNDLVHTIENSKMLNYADDTKNIYHTSNLKL